MFFSDIRKKYFNITFLIIAIIGIFWLYSTLKPTATTNVGDFYKYNYFKPLNKAEFIYFNLTNDYKRNSTIAFYKPKKEKQMWGIYTKKLGDIEKEYFLHVIKKINPSFDISEKMDDVSISMGYSKMKPYLKELEKKLNIRSFYYAAMNSPTYYVKGYKSSNSPYWVYKKCTKRFHGKKYKDAVNDFILTYQNGISKGYSHQALENLELLIGIFAILYSFRFYAEEKRANVNGYIYTCNAGSVKIVLFKYLATAAPLMCLSIVYILFEAACFMYWNNLFNYGYDISVMPFLIQTPFIIFPTILIITAAGQFTGVLFQSETVTAIIQFLLYYVSMASMTSHKLSLSFIVRYGNFDDYSLYQGYSGNILLNRIIMVFFSVILTVCTVKIFNYRREHGNLIILKSIGDLGFYKTFKRIIYPRSLSYYICRQTIDKSMLLYILYLCLMSPFIIQTNIKELDIAIIGENIIIFASLFLFVRLGNMEQNYGMESYVYTSNSFYPFIYMSRVALACAVLFVMIFTPVTFICLLNNVHLGRWCIGVYLSSLFLGIFSLLVTEFFESCFAGYFSYIMYYFFDVILNGKIPLSILGYTNLAYVPPKSKVRLGIAIIAMIVMLSVTVYIKMKGIRVSWKNGNRN